MLKTNFKDVNFLKKKQNTCEPAKVNPGGPIIRPIPIVGPGPVRPIPLGPGPVVLRPGQIPPNAQNDASDVDRASKDALN